MTEVIHRIERFEGHEYILRIFKGTVKVEDVFDSFEYIVSSKMISPLCKGILTDFRDCTLDFEKLKFKNLIEYVRGSSALKGVRIAVVVDTSQNIVFPMIASNEKGMVVQPFSTIEAAQKWIIM